MMNTSTPVVVLGLDTHGSLAIARTLGRLGVPVHGIHSSADAATFASRYCRHKFIWDINDSSPEATIAFLRDVAHRIGQRSFLIPTADEGSMFVAEHTESLREDFIFPEVSVDLVRSLSSKKSMYYLAKRLSIPTPETAFPQSRDEVIEFRRSARFPIMLKGIDGNLLKRRTGKKMVIVHNAAELLDYYDRLEDSGQPNLMLQEYIPGGEDTIWMFNGYFDHNSDCLAAFVGKKIRQSPVYTGATSLGICLANPVVEQTTRDFMKAVGYRGILDIGYRYDARDGQYKVLDINPRIGATFRLFADANDYDVARIMYLDMTGQPVPRVHPVQGRKWVVEFNDLRSCLQYRKDKRLTLTQWLRSYSGVQECAYFANDDLKPFLHECRDALARRFERLFHRSASSRTQSPPLSVSKGTPVEEEVSFSARN